MVAVDAKAASVADIATFVPTLTLDTPHNGIAITAIAAAVVTSNQPFLTTAMRLYTHHALRC